MSSQKSNYPLTQCVEVEWRDSASRGGWASLEDHRSRSQVGPIRSVGYVLQHTKDVLQLAQSMSSMNGDVSDTITIPREAVRRITPIGPRRR